MRGGANGFVPYYLKRDDGTGVQKLSIFVFTSQHSIEYQSFEASRKMTRHQQLLTLHGFDTTSI